MLLEITQEDIDTGIVRNISNCAIAKAIKRLLDTQYVNVCVTTNAMELNGRHYELPQSATDFIYLFDHGDAQPITLDIPELVLA